MPSIEDDKHLEWLESQRQQNDDLQKLLNPPELEKASDSVFVGSERASSILKQFSCKSCTYHTMGAKGETEKIREAANAIRWNTRTDVNVHFAIPSDLMDISEPTEIIIWIRWHGGGGATGKPLIEDWLLTADYEFMLRQKKAHIISVEPEYPLMPESSGKDLENVVRLFCSWVSDHLERRLRSFNPFFSVDWSRLSIFGESFGAYPAMHFWVNLKRVVHKPELQIRGMILRWPLVGDYKRAWGPYCGRDFPLELSAQLLQNVSELHKSTSILVRRAGQEPPNGMPFSWASSIHGVWSTWFDARTVFDVIQETSTCPGNETAFYITHGTHDKLVPYQSSIKLKAVLEKTWPGMKVSLILQEGRDHGWDYGQPLTDAYTAVLDQFCA